MRCSRRKRWSRGSSAGCSCGLAGGAERLSEEAEPAATANAIEACAAHHLDRLDRRNEALAAVKERQAAAPEAAFGAFLCTGRTPDAVASLKAMLLEPATRPQ